MRTAKLVTISVVTGFAISCAGGASSGQDEAGVRAAINGLVSAVNAADTTALFQLMADDFEVFPPGSNPLRGDGARSLFRGMFADASPSLEPFSHEELEVSGTLAVQRYTFRLTLRSKSGGPTTTEAGSGLHVWRRGSDGRWRLARDIWTEPATNPSS